MMRLDELDLLNLQTEYMRQDPTTQALCAALNRQFHALRHAIDQLHILTDIQNLDSLLLDELAWQYHVDEYDVIYPLATKRQLIRDAIRVHKYRGTKYACEQVMTSIFGPGSVIEEWFEYGGEPGCFRVRTTNAAVTDDMAEEFAFALETVKNVRSRLETILVELSGEMDLSIGVAIHIGEVIYI